MNSRIFNNPLISFSGAIAGSVLILYFSKRICEIKYLETPISFLTYLGKISIIILIFHVVVVEGFQWNIYLNNWISLALFRFIFSLIFSKILTFIPILKYVYYGENLEYRSQLL